MTRIEKSIQINASPENVWQAILPENMPQWYEMFKKVEWTSKEIHRKGSTFHVNNVLAGERSDFDAEMIEVAENKRGIWRVISGKITGVGGAELKPTESGTLISLSMDYKMPYSIIGRMMDKIRVQKEMERNFELGLQDLKYILEAS